MVQRNFLRNTLGSLVAPAALCLAVAFAGLSLAPAAHAQATPYTPADRPAHPYTPKHLYSETADPNADIPDFNFAISTNLLDFDVIWMIGDGGLNDTQNPPIVEGTKPPLDVAQLNAIANFMEQGGGVFAVGDHYSLGSAMCGQIPRVRVMRSWYGENDTNKPAALTAVPDNFPVFGIGRADTTLINPSGVYPATDASNNPTVTPYVYFENQSDALPQTIVPTSSPAHPNLAEQRKRHHGLSRPYARRQRVGRGERL